MLSVAGEVNVRCTIEDAWDLFSRFHDVAQLIPTVENVEVDGQLVHAIVSTKLGALPITSRVTLRVVETKRFEYIKAEGLSYLGETIKEQIKKNVEGVAKDSVGKLLLHLDLRRTDEDGVISIVYTADIEAKGRLKRIYKAILKTKVPAMMEEFAQNLRRELEREADPIAEVTEPLPEPAALALREPPVPEPHEVEPPRAALAPRTVGLWARFVAWLRRVLRPLRGSS